MKSLKSIIKSQNLTFEYIRRDEEGNVEGITTAVDDVSFDINEGDFIAILGHNGSGKSTLAKHINAILYPTEGTVWVNGLDTSDEENLWEIRQSAGMVFQNPDNQIIGQIVEEDVGFGPENLGVPTEEILQRVEESLKAVGMYEFRMHSPNKLSGGQKQRISIAGVLAMHPKCIVLDEPTAMLDPQGRREVIRAIRALNDVEKITIILITHNMEETIYADHIFVMDQGKIALEGSPKTVFSQVEKLENLRLSVPPVTKLAYELRKAGLPIPLGVLDRKELVGLVTACVGREGKGKFESNIVGSRISESNISESNIPGSSIPGSNISGSNLPGNSKFGAGNLNTIILDNVSYAYDNDGGRKSYALKNVSLVIPGGQFVALIGHTGSGKSTLVQHLNGLLKPTSGNVYYNGADIHDDDYDRKNLRAHVGLVFQYPEHQLFEETVFKDVCFGPSNLGLDDKEIQLRSFDALEKVKLEHDYFYQSPFDLSGGQKRRVAIAGVLAMKPSVLILDEPTAGLDPKGQKEILNLIKALQKDTNMTIILVSHSMEDVADYVDRVVVMNEGSVYMDGTPKEVFKNAEGLKKIGLDVPEVTKIVSELKARGMGVDENATTIGEAVQTIVDAM